MNEETLREMIAEHINMIKFSARSMNEAPQRATSFLIMQAVLVDEKRTAEEDKVKLSTLSTASYAQAVGRSKASNITGQKLEAESETTYTSMREALEQCEAKISWLRAYIDIFQNAHVTYRQYSKE